MHLRTTSGPSRINDDIEFDRQQWQRLLAYQHHFQDQNHRDPSITEPDTDECSTFHVSYLRDFFVYVITETMMQYPWVYVTEKTWKAMLAPVPFMLVGTPGTLAWLRQRGFRTFDQWWDELDHGDLVRMRQSLQPVLDHNLANLRDLRERELAKIRAVL
jgi:hypothetical protein